MESKTPIVLLKKNNLIEVFHSFSVPYISFPLYYFRNNVYNIEKYKLIKKTDTKVVYEFVDEIYRIGMNNERN